MEDNLKIRAQQAISLIEAMKELKAKSGHAIATKQVHDKSTSLENENKQLTFKKDFLEHENLRL